VGRISETGAGFLVEVRDPGGATLEVAGRVVVDAGGRTSRLSPASGSGGSFGVRYSEPRDPGDTLEFGFFDWGYGGTVGTGDGEANSAFLVSRSALSRFLGRGDCQVTGPIAYRRRPSPWIRVGDAAGMVDPFSGEGMRQAFESAARVAGLLARGLHAGWRYPTMREAARAQAGAGAFAGPDRLLRALSQQSWPACALRVPGLGALVLEALWRRP
jgi:flavin-dependent dehydrogenase